MAGQQPYELEELGDETFLINLAISPGATDDYIVFCPDRDCWLQHAWIVPSDSDSGVALRLITLDDGDAQSTSGATAQTAELARISAGGGLATANTKTDFVVDATSNYVKAGEHVILRQTASLKSLVDLYTSNLPILFCARFSTRQH